MKCRIPYQKQQNAVGARKRAVATMMLLFCRNLADSEGFGTDRINRFMETVNAVTEELTDYSFGSYRNKTWGVELEHWAEKTLTGLPTPQEYRLLIRGELPATGYGPWLLLVMLLLSLHRMGYGKDRLSRVVEKYAGISGLHGGAALYSKEELLHWAEEKKIRYI